MTASPAVKALDAGTLAKELVAHGHLVPVAVKGAFGRGAVFEDVLQRLDALIVREAGGPDLESVTFPPVIDRTILERTGYMDSFPNLCGSVHSFCGTEREARAISGRIGEGKPWGDLLGTTDVVLTPAACYPLYPTCAGTLPPGGRHVTLIGWAYRNEPSDEPTRLRAFRVREVIRIGEPHEVLAWRDLWREKGVALLESLGLTAHSDVAADPFFGRGGKVLAAGQIEQRLKFEVLIPVISAEKPTACCSFNYHQDKFGAAFAIRTAGGAVAHSACLGYGMERVTMALLQTHGFDPRSWPAGGTAEALAVTRHRVVPGLEAEGYRRHSLHDERRTWVEKNCYVDVWIEVLHALGLEPQALLGACAAVDYEGDGFTFFKPSHDELRAAFGIDVNELNVWLPLVEHAEHHLSAGRLVATEADSFWLPDTAGTEYRRGHVKTTIVLADLDVEGRRLGYFHNAGYFELEGADFAGLFRVGAEPDPAFLPLFAEIVRLDRLVRRPSRELAARAQEMLAQHVARRPRANPIARFARALERDLETIRRRGLAWYHGWAFATVRQMGSCFELLACHLRWLVETGHGDELTAPACEFEAIAAAAKALVLKAARASNTGRPLDGAALLGTAAEAWDKGMASLARLVPAPAAMSMQ